MIDPVVLSAAVTGVEAIVALVERLITESNKPAPVLETDPPADLSEVDRAREEALARIRAAAVRLHAVAPTSSDPAAPAATLKP